MNGLRASVAELEKMIAGAERFSGKADLMICPPATLLARFADAAKGSPIAIGAQDCHAQASGAFTGDISAEMIADAGASAVIVGHSERRTDHEESDADCEGQGRRGSAREAHWPSSALARPGRSGRRMRQLPRIQRQLDGSLPDGSSGETGDCL